MKNLLSSIVLGVLASVTSAQNTCTAPSSLSFSDSALPDPFQFAGTNNRARTVADWQCRRQEISQLIQRYELGSLPTTTPRVSASVSGNRLTITVTDNGRSITFTPTISYPSSGSAPFPAVIAYGFLSIPAQAGVATISFNNDDIAAQAGPSSRGRGKFYTLYGSGHSAGAMTAWAWGVSRIIDALENTSAARIDPRRLAVTGCSRNAKGAMVAGALDSRIALTIPQESGSGGAACWRLSLAERQGGSDVQTATQIVGENVWFSTSFNNYVNNLAQLPYDHHMLAGLVAPRGLLVLENTDYIWLSPRSSFGCMTAARSIYQALGATDSFGYSQIGGHAHCAFPSSQGTILAAYFNRFLKGQSANTAVFQSSQRWPGSGQSQWIRWTAPQLSGSGSGGSTTLTTSATPAPTPGGGGRCTVERWGQCGGLGYTGCTTCAPGSTCNAVSPPYYSQCL